MVKMPSLDDLKKAGAGLMDQAKASGFGGMVDKMKAGIDSVTVKKDGTPVQQGDDAIKGQFQILSASLAELTQLQAAQAAQVKKVEAQLALLSRAVSASQTATVSSTTVITETTSEEKKK